MDLFELSALPVQGLFHRTPGFPWFAYNCSSKITLSYCFIDTTPKLRTYLIDGSLKPLKCTDKIRIISQF